MENIRERFFELFAGSSGFFVRRLISGKRKINLLIVMGRQKADLFIYDKK